MHATGVHRSLQGYEFIQLTDGAARGVGSPCRGYESGTLRARFLEDIKEGNLDFYGHRQIIYGISGKWVFGKVIEYIMPRNLRTNVKAARKYGLIVGWRLAVSSSDRWNDNSSVDVNVPRPRLPKIGDVQIKSNCAIESNPYLRRWLVWDNQGGTYQGTSSFVGGNGSCGGILSGSGRDMGGFVGAAHSAPLQQRGPETEGSNNRNNPCRVNKAPRNSYETIISGLIALFSSALIIRLALEFLNETHTSRRYIAPTIICGLLVFILIVHGLFIACLGVWLPYSASIYRSTRTGALFQGFRFRLLHPRGSCRRRVRQENAGSLITRVCG